MGTYAGRAVVVDDELGVREFCRAVLTQMGYTVEVCVNGQEALALFAAAPIDLMLIDVHMPHMNGIELLRRIRQRDQTVSLIVMTGNGSLEHIAQVLLLGGQAILLKPFALAELRTMVSEVQRKRRIARAEAQTAVIHPLAVLSDQLLGVRELPLLCEQIVAGVCDALNADRVLLLREQGGTGLAVVAQTGSLAPDAPETGLSVAVQAFQKRRPAVLAVAEPKPADPAKLPPDAQYTLICAPLIAAGAMLGVLQVERCSPRAPLLQPQVELLMVIARIVASALESAELHTTLARSEARYRALLEHARDAVLVISRDGQRILEVNAAAAAISGYSSAELVRQNVSALLHTNTASTAQLVHGQGEFDTLLRTAGNREIPVSVVASVIAHESAEFLLLVVRDISERTRLSQQLVQAEKLAGMSRLTASIAHEVNNPLQALHSALNLLVERQIPDEKRAQILHMAHVEVESLVGIVQHMMDLYRPVREGVRPVSPHELLEAVLTMLQPRLREHSITVERDWQEFLPRVRCAHSQLKQVFSSLLLNAIDAMPNGGRLTLRTRASDHDGQPMVQIEVADTGGGIAADELPNVFEPFYSKRKQRAGLSLAVSYSIIEQHGGRLSVEPAEEGACFRIILPAES
ncbi:MAG: response regulator [Roseiflexaceae bacterium]|nr:response regulator [Roseiflexaceae bacterium]